MGENAHKKDAAPPSVDPRWHSKHDDRTGKASSVLIPGPRKGDPEVSTVRTNGGYFRGCRTDGLNGRGDPRKEHLAGNFGGRSRARNAVVGWDSGEAFFGRE